MALPLGKLTILVGAGLVGSVVAMDGMPDVSSLVSGVFKVVWRQLRSDPSPSVSKPRNDFLVQQVNSLRQEIDMLSMQRPITIVSTSGKGATKYGVVVIVVVVGYGYVWLKGWKLPDMMFATRRGLSDACTTVAKQLENVYASVRKTRRELSEDIDRVDSNLNEVARLTADTQERVTELRDESARIGDNFRSVRNVVETLEEKISRIEGKQDLTTVGVKRLVHIAHNMERNMIEQNMQAASSSSRITYSSKLGSLPPPSPTSFEPSTPFSDESAEVQQSQQDTSSISGQQSLGISGVVDGTSSSSGSGIIGALDEANDGGSNWFAPAFLSRTRSAASALLQRTGSSKQQA